MKLVHLTLKQNVRTILEDGIGVDFLDRGNKLIYMCSPVDMVKWLHHLCTHYDASWWDFAAVMVELPKDRVFMNSRAGYYYTRKDITSDHIQYALPVGHYLASFQSVDEMQCKP